MENLSRKRAQFHSDFSSIDFNCTIYFFKYIGISAFPRFLFQTDNVRTKHFLSNFFFPLREYETIRPGCASIIDYNDVSINWSMFTIVWATFQKLADTVFNLHRSYVSLKKKKLFSFSSFGEKLRYLVLK